MSKIQEIDNKMIEFTMQKFHHYGLDRLQSQIYAVLLVEPEPVSLEYLAKRTDYSLASVSKAVKFLSRFNLITKTRKPGTKKIYVSGQKNMLEMVEKKMILSLEIEVTPTKRIVPELIDEYKQAMKTASKTDKESAKKKVKIMEEYLKNMLLLERLQIKGLEMIRKELI